MTNPCLQSAAKEPRESKVLANNPSRRGLQSQRGPAGRGKGAHGGRDANAVVDTEPKLVRGRDGRAVQIRPGFVAVQGRDGRMVAIPSGSGSLEGSDGRVVAIPPGYLGIENAKGRVVPKPRW